MILRYMEKSQRGNKTSSGRLKFQSQNPHGTVGTGQGFIHAYFAGGNKAAFLHNAAAGGVVNEVTADERLDVRCLADMVKHQPQGLCTDALVPIGLPYPVAHQWLARAGREVVALTRHIAHCADGFARLLEFYGPGGVIVENGPDHLQAFLHGFVRRPACPCPHIRIGSVFEQRLCITFAPRAQLYSVSHRDKDTLFCRYGPYYTRRAIRRVSYSSEYSCNAKKPFFS